MRAVDSALYNSDTTRIPPSSGVQLESRRRSIPTAPRDGYRTVSTRSSNPRTISSSSSRTVRSSTHTARGSSRASTPRSSSRTGTPRSSRASTDTPSSAAVAPGREIHAIRSQPKAITATSNLIPIGHVTKGDLKCIVCFDDVHTGDQPIILCPHCKYPCHEDEFIAWSASSNLCARCSKPISKAYLKNPKYRFSAKDYVAKVINKL